MRSLFCIVVVLSIAQLASAQPSRKRLAITIDDPNGREQPLFNWQERNERILAALKKHHAQAALFVCGMRMSPSVGPEILSTWDSAGHSICNHSWFHSYYPSPKISADSFYQEILRVDSMISHYKHYTKLFRFPYLKEGATAAKRDSMRLLLRQLGYRNGYVTIDASDWYVDQRVDTKLKQDPSADLTPYKNYYVKHILNRIGYYDSLAISSGVAPKAHTLLLHHTLLNALFLDTLLAAIEQNGWTIIPASEAYTADRITKEPNVLPAGESLIYSIAKEQGAEGLRYPAEDGDYEAGPLNTDLIEYERMHPK